MSVQDNLKLGKKIYELFNNNKLEELANLFSENSTSLHVPTNEVFKGINGARHAANKWRSAFPDGKCEVTNQVVSENYIVTEFNGVGTNDGNLDTPMGTLPPTGRKVNIPFVEIMKIKNGKIEDYKLYFDIATMMQQLGIVAEKVS